MNTDQEMKIAGLRKRWQEAETKATEARMIADNAVGRAESLEDKATTLFEQYEDACLEDGEEPNVEDE